MPSLAQTLEATRASVVKRLPEEVLEKIERHIAELRASRIVDGILKAGDPMPPFTLQNQRGEQIGSASLLARGPLVLTFYRGTW